MSMPSYSAHGTTAELAVSDVDMSNKPEAQEIDKAVKEVVDMTIEQIHSDTFQQVNLQLFTK